MDDRRRLPRWSIAGKVLYRKQGRESASECLSKNISSSGTCISLSEAIELNSEIDLDIHLGPGLLPIATKGKVRWLMPSMDSRDNPFLAGVHFDYLADEDKEKIFNYAFQYRRDEVTKRWWQGV